ncbi:MAG: hypothetical protein IPJ65_13860 [Archangiaceae bacterium]|nr:hypothetical protein [Archangiaceae bacterium]
MRDRLAVAALRAAGVRAEQLAAPTDSGLGAARSLGNHGQCNPAHYPVGAVLERARGSGCIAAFARAHTWLVPASCGPCRLAAFPLEWQRVLEGTGLAELQVERVDPLAFLPALDRGPGFGLLLALVAGDVLESLGHALRPYAADAGAFETALERETAAVAAAVERDAPLDEALGSAARALRGLPFRGDRILPRVLLTGEPWTTLAGGDPSYDAAVRLAGLGAEIDAPRLIDWFRALAWQSAAARPVRSLGALWRRLARSAGLPGRLSHPARLAALAADWYPAAVRGGSGFLEVARALEAAGSRTAHLVVSLKPFGCLPSSALSDGVLSPLLARQRAGPAFLALETTGDSHASVDSRLEMALHAAALRALGEAESACAARGLDLATARARLGRQRVPELTGPRAFASSAAERIARGEADR